MEFEAKFGEVWAPRKTQKSHFSRKKFAPVEGLSHDLVCTGSIYHVHFAWQVWHGQLSPRFKFNKLKSFSGVEIDQNHVDKRILRGKGFAVGRDKRHNFCPASVLITYHLALIFLFSKPPNCVFNYLDWDEWRVLNWILKGHGRVSLAVWLPLKPTVAAEETKVDTWQGNWGNCLAPAPKWAKSSNLIKDKLTNTE